MNIEELRDYCLSLPDTTEKMPFQGFFHNHESLLTFNVGNHIFRMKPMAAESIVRKRMTDGKTTMEPVRVTSTG